ncbi:hypothetical protein DMC47_04635 [Nostoc sp. 3335mG]|nr:hypothetical protein DMC47_04635 [Nostoc sp. 3335mG]
MNAYILPDREIIMVRTLTAFALLLATGVPALAAPFCTGDDIMPPGGFGITIGEPYTDEERDNFDEMYLRQLGVNVQSDGIERWNGCIRAYVVRPDGTLEQQFFEPGSYRRVY